MRQTIPSMNVSFDSHYSHAKGNIGSRSDEEEEYSTDVIPRQMPTPAAQPPSLHPHMLKNRLFPKQHQNDYDSNCEQVGQVAVQSSSGQNENGPKNGRKEVNAGISAETKATIETKTINKGAGQSDKTNIDRIRTDIAMVTPKNAFKYMASKPSTQILGSISSPPQRCITTQQRIDSITSKLSEMGLVPLQQGLENNTGTASGTSNRNSKTKIQEVNGDMENYQHFLHILHSMAVAHAGTTNSKSRHDGNNINTNNGGLNLNDEAADYNNSAPLHGMLSMIESIIDEAMHLSQECEYWRMKTHQRQRNAYSSEENALRMENQSLRSSLRNLEESYLTLEMKLHQAKNGESTVSSIEMESLRLRESQQLQDLQRNEVELHSVLSSQQLEHDRVLELLNRLQVDHKNLKQSLESKGIALDRTERDLQKKLYEGQAVTVEKARLQSEVTSLRKRLEEEVRRADRAVHDARLSDMSREEMATTLRLAVEERSNLEKQVGELTRERVDLHQEMDTIKVEKSRLEGQVENLSEDFRVQFSDTASSQRKLEQVTRNTKSLQHSLDVLKQENKVLRRDLDASRETLDVNSQQTLEFQRIAAKTQHDAEAFQILAAETESERGILQKLLEDERSRIHDLEGVISTARVQEAAAAEQIRKLVRVNAQLSIKVNQANARLAHSRENTPVKSSSDASQRSFDTFRASSRKNRHLNEVETDKQFVKIFDKETSVSDDGDGNSLSSHMKKNLEKGQLEEEKSTERDHSVENDDISI